MTFLSASWRMANAWRLWSMRVCAQVAIYVFAGQIHSHQAAKPVGINMAKATGRKVLFLTLPILLAIALIAYFAAQIYIQKRIAATLNGLVHAHGETRPMSITSVAYKDLSFILATRSLELSGIELRGELYGPDGRRHVTASAGSVRMAQVSTRSIGRLKLDSLRIETAGAWIVSLKSAIIDDISLPDDAFFDGLDGNNWLKRVLALPRPLFEKCLLSGLDASPATQPGQVASVADCKLAWPTANPIDITCQCSALALPKQELETSLGFALPHLDLVRGDASLSLLGGDGALAAGLPSSMTVSGMLSANELCRLDFSFREAGVSELSWFDILRYATFSDVRVKYRDEGLFACLARRILPYAEAASMALKIAGGNLFRSGDPRDSQTLAGLEAFIDRPGTIELASKEPFSLARAIEQASLGRLGSIFALKATPGEKSLGQKMSETATPGSGRR